MSQAKDESKRDFSRVYKGASNSLNVNENFGDHAQADGLVYNEVRRTGVIMEHRITAVFDNRDQAEYARKELLLAGFDSDALILIEGYDSSDETEASDAGVPPEGSLFVCWQD